MIATLFPGQGSQKPGMGADLATQFAEAREAFAAASEAVGIDLLKLCTETDEDTLRQTQNAQLALFVCGVAAHRVLTARGVAFGATAGHSVGEYAAAVAAGVMSLEDGARLVKKRGEVMAESGREWPGTMAAVLGLDRPDLERVCEDTPGVVVIANDNCPGQLVISGEIEAVGAAGKLATERGAKRVLPLNVSGAFHSPLMVEPAKQMGPALASVAFRNPPIPLFGNVEAAPVASGMGYAELLERQLGSPVRWTESMQAMRAAGVTTFVELGAGEVLCGLLKRIDRSATAVAAYDAASVAKTLETLSA